MNQDGPEAAKSSDSDSYSSPAASGDSEREASVSSIETTPPPNGEYPYGHQKSGSMASSGFSRSYQSVFSHGAPQHRREWSHSSNRPGTTQSALTEDPQAEDQADLAAAVGLLSCSYATPKTGPTAMPADLPQVPALAEKYQYNRDVSMDRSQKDSHSPRNDEDDQIFGEMEE